MDWKERRDKGVPQSALLRFRDSQREYCGRPGDGKLKLCFCGMSLFTSDMSAAWKDHDSSRGEYIILVSWSDDAVPGVAAQYPAGWLDEHCHQLPVMASLAVAARLLHDLSHGGYYSPVGLEQQAGSEGETTQEYNSGSGSDAGKEE